MSYALNLSVVCVCVCVCVCVHVLSGCLTLCDPIDCRPPGSSVYGIFQTRILNWVAISWDLPNPGIERASLTSSALAGIVFTTVPPGKPQTEKWLKNCYPFTKKGRQSGLM